MTSPPWPLGAAFLFRVSLDRRPSQRVLVWLKKQGTLVALSGFPCELASAFRFSSTDGIGFRGGFQGRTGRFQGRGGSEERSGGGGHGGSKGESVIPVFRR